MSVLPVCALGSSTSRSVSCVPVDEDRIIVSLSSFVVLWDVRRKVILKSVHAGGDVVNTLVGGCQGVMGITRNGVIRLFDWELEILDTYQGFCPKIMSGSWSVDGQYFVGTSEGSFDGDPNLIYLFEIVSGRILLKKLFESEVNRYFHAIFAKDHIVFCVKQLLQNEIQEKKNKNSFIPEDSLCLTVIDADSCEIIREQIVQNMINEETIEFYVKYIYKVETNKEGLVSLAQRGEISVYDVDNLEIQWSIDTRGNNMVNSLIFQDHRIILTGIESGKISSMTENRLDQSYQGSYGSTFIGWAKLDEIFWLVGSDSINHVNIITGEIMEIKFHSIVCVGIQFSPSGKSIACGDFGGNITVWDIENTTCLKSGNTGYLPIRSLLWTEENCLYAGTMSGELFRWENEDIGKILQTDNSITVIRQSADKSMIALGTTGGFLYILDITLNIQIQFQAHLPTDQPQDLRFGSMGKYAEIWSLDWSPDNTKIATCSEDQTTKIWDLNGNLIETLTGHTTAVTSIEWKKILASDISFDYNGEIEILITCADDQTVMVWTHINSKFELYHIFDTKIMKEWHTLTYVTFISPKSIICGTQNGFIFTWDLETKSNNSHGKYHIGSVEGLASHQEEKLFASCSADCSVSVFNLQY